jgi:hypothetical protein
LIPTPYITCLPQQSSFNGAIELSRLLRVQKAVFSIIMPSIEGYQRTMFDPDTIEDIGGEDEDILSEREIRCVTFPGILKLGNKNGERTASFRRACSNRAHPTAVLGYRGSRLSAHVDGFEIPFIVNLESQIDSA